MATTAEHGEGYPEVPVSALIAAGGVALSLLLIPLGLSGNGLGPERGPRPAEQVAAVADGYLEAWEGGDLDAMRQLVASPPASFDAVHLVVAQGLSVDDVRLRPGVPHVRGTVASVPFTASMDLAGLGTWSYDGRLDLVLAEPEPSPEGDHAQGSERESATGSDEPRWAVSWSPDTVHPSLAPGLSLARSRQHPPRAPLLGADGAPLTGEEAPSLPALSAQVLGRVVAADADVAAALGPSYLAGDTVGTSGLQAAFEARLAGRASGSVHVVDEAGDVVEILHRFPGQDPEPVRTTFDAEVQAAAESALGRSRKPAALVAVDATTGAVRAVANRPTSGFNRALMGRYPPGSTFKVVTSTALLASGITPATPTSCPATASIGGFRFSNAGGEALGDIPFRTAFFRSCNTAFVQLADELDAAALTAAAESYGFNGDFGLPIPAAAGSFPQPSGPIDQAAAAIGQGRVTATPLQMATVAAAVASGTWRPPQVVVPAEPPPGRPLPPATAETLRQLMYLVVGQGTGTAALLPGEPVGGKTGTAEYGTARPPRSHAWFIGFRGDLAVAVLVEDGGFGGSVAAPIAGTFLSALD